MSAASTPLPSTTSRLATGRADDGRRQAGCRGVQQHRTGAERLVVGVRDDDEQASCRPARRLLRLLGRPSSCAPRSRRSVLAEDRHRPWQYVKVCACARGRRRRTPCSACSPCSPGRPTSWPSRRSAASGGSGRGPSASSTTSPSASSRRASRPRPATPAAAAAPSTPSRMPVARPCATGSVFPAPPSTDLEGMVKVFFADAGSKDQLDALERIEAQASDRLAEIAGLALALLSSRSACTSPRAAAPRGAGAGDAAVGPLGARAGARWPDTTDPVTGMPTASSRRSWALPAAGPDRTRAVVGRRWFAGPMATTHATATKETATKEATATAAPTGRHPTRARGRRTR